MKLSNVPTDKLLAELQGRLDAAEKQKARMSEFVNALSDGSITKRRGTGRGGRRKLSPEARKAIAKGQRERRAREAEEKKALAQKQAKKKAQETPAV